ncbi:hypothetical protein T05_13562 [Trichinella murrelli]|uniref:Uncharacterized protein n=1 Tax=Trichinella murrelli TaxID=144512 RepID=A0A0V0TQ12_9BILA|nr:hypothetical protein T05_13562 [Trichinella murrelli]
MVKFTIRNSNVQMFNTNVKIVNNVETDFDCATPGCCAKLLKKNYTKSNDPQQFRTRRWQVPTLGGSMLATLAGAECGRRVVVCAGWNVTIVWFNFEYPASCITLLLLDGVFPGGRTDFFPSPLHDHRIWVTVRLSVEYSLGVN